MFGIIKVGKSEHIKSKDILKLFIFNSVFHIYSNSNDKDIYMRIKDDIYYLKTLFSKQSVRISKEFSFHSFWVFTEIDTTGKTIPWDKQ
jgi:hypothetical protein